jgi:FkbM family methyltransferase
LFREYYEPGLLLLERFLAPGMTFVDGGANKGIYTFAAARLVGATGCVLAFEPGKESFVALQKSLEINRFEQVVLRKQALADRATRARLYHHRSRENSFGLGTSNDPRVGFEEVETITLEQACAEIGLQRIDFAEFDVEGSQELVLRGSIGLVLRWKPILLVEVDCEACRRLNLEPDGTWQLLFELGYAFFVINDSSQVYPIANPRGFRTLLAVHEKSPILRELHH